MATEPRLWLGLRRLDALGLCACALFLGGASATAAGLPAATDPSAAGGDLAWQQIDGPGMLRLHSGARSVLPGDFPALDGSSVAWYDGGQITVADLASMAPRATVPVAHLTALAVSNSWVVYREEGAHGGESLIGVSLLDPAQRHRVASSRLAGELGRPALDGARVLFTVDTPRRSAIETMNLTTGARRVLRSAAVGAVLMNPVSLHGRLAYERANRCAQELRIGSWRANRRDRVLLRLSSTVRRDPGYEQGYEHAYNSASLCSNRRSGRGIAKRLGPIALAATTVYVTEEPRDPKRARILAFRR